MECTVQQLTKGKKRVWQVSLVRHLLIVVSLQSPPVCGEVAFGEAFATSLGGGSKEFSFSDADIFLGVEDEGTFLSSQERQAIILDMLNNVRFSPGHPSPFPQSALRMHEGQPISEFFVILQSCPSVRSGSFSIDLFRSSIVPRQRIRPRRRTSARRVHINVLAKAVGASIPSAPATR